MSRGNLSAICICYATGALRTIRPPLRNNATSLLRNAADARTMPLSMQEALTAVPDTLTSRPLFADTLSQLMDSAGVSGSELARRLGSNRTSVSRWRSGEDLPRPQFVAEIADTLGVDRASLLQAAGYLRPDDIQTQEAPPFPADDDETELIKLFRQLSNEQRSPIRDLLRMLAVGAVPPTSPRGKRRSDGTHKRLEHERTRLLTATTVENDDTASPPDNGRIHPLWAALATMWTRVMQPAPARFAHV